MARTNVARAVESSCFQYAQRVDGAVFFRFTPAPGTKRRSTWSSGFTRNADGSYQCTTQWPEAGTPIPHEGMRVPTMCPLS